MKLTLANFSKTVLGSAIFALIPAMLFASIYTTFKDGFAQSKLDNFDIFDFWRFIPLNGSPWSSTFEIILMIFGATVLIIVVAACALTFKKISNSHGSAKWASFDDFAKRGFLKPHKKIINSVFGKTTKPKSSGKYLTNGKHAHSIVVAPTRAGKGVGVVIPTLLTFNGSMVVLDVKGELFDLTSRARKANGDKVYKFNPMAEDRKTHRYNPIEKIVELPKERQFTEARRLSANLITAKSKGAEGFLDGARDLFAAGVILAIEKGTPTIGAVYDFFSQSGDKNTVFSSLAVEAESNEATKIFNNMAGNDLKIITSYTSVLGDGGLNLWADPFIKAATEKTDFDISKLRKDPSTIYLCVSPNDLEILSPLMRLLFQQIVGNMQNELPKDDEIFEVLFLLDEFKSLGKLSLIETAVTTIAGFGGRFMFVIQNLSNLTEIYGQQGKENFLGNCGIQVFMATSDADTPEYISRAIGDFTRTSRSKSWSSKELFGGSNIQERQEGSRLIRPEEIRLLPEDEEIALVIGESPMKLKKIRYYEDSVFKKIFEKQSGELPLPKALVFENVDHAKIQQNNSLSKDKAAILASMPDIDSIPDEGIVERVNPEKYSTDEKIDKIKRVSKSNLDLLATINNINFSK